MEILNDGIHNCKKCDIYKKCKVPCSSQPELTVPACKVCDTRSCCISPFLVLMPCEKNTILDKIDEGEYIESEGIIPSNIKTRYCKHMDMITMNCKVYAVRPIACRIAGHSCTTPFWLKAMTEMHEKSLEAKALNI